MVLRSLRLLAIGSFAGGCGGGVFWAAALLIAIAVAVSIRNAASLSHRTCRYCGNVGATAHLHEKGFVDYVTCDRCGKEL
jgi:hypothetical protein